MSDGVQLPIAALEFMAAEPSPVTLEPLGGLSHPALLTLIRALEHRELVDHLELVNGYGALGRDIRKAASAAAYRLHSRGIKPTVRATATALKTQDEPVELDLLGLVSPPGLVGRFWMLLGSMPGIEAIEVKGDADGGIEAIEVIRPVSRSKLDKLAREFERKQVRGIPVRASADLLVQTIGTWGRMLASGRVPPMWREVEAWSQAAIRYGAEGRRASARAQLKKGEPALSFPELYKLEAGGIHLPTPGVVQTVLNGMSELLDKPAVEPSWVAQKAAQLSRDSLGGWLSIPLVRERLAAWLEVTADVMYSQKRLPAAAGFLALADELGPEADGHALVHHPFFHQLEIELLGSDVRR